MNVKIVKVIFFLLSSFTMLGQSLVINEIMYSNEDVVLDGNNEYTDWIEIYNTSNSAINLEGYGLSDDEDDLLKWVFPNISIGVGEFLLVFANGENDGVDGWLHTNFKLETSGEAVFLTNDLAEILDQVGDNTQPNNISLGRCPDGAEAFSELLYPSPNGTNNENNVVTTSHVAGFYTEPIDLDIVSNGIENDDIYYTLDGSIPNADVMLFATPLTIESRVGDPNILSQIVTTLSSSSFQPSIETFKINVIRYASFRNGIRNSIIYSKSYLIDNDMFSRYDYPIISLITEEDNFFDYDTGIYVPGANFDAGNSQWTGNYFMRGSEWERDAHLEFFEENGDLSFTQDAGVRIHGGKKRGSRVKSLQFFARKEYGKKKFYYDFFEDGTKDEYKRIVLRNYHACWNKTVIKDAATHRICDDLDMEKMRSRPVVLFLNGEYWGMHGMRDRLGDFHLADLADVDNEEVNVLIHGSGINPDRPLDWGIVDGTNTNYIELMDFIEDNEMATEVNYNYVQTKLDISSMIDYYCAEIFFNNKDWITNNYKVWNTNQADSKWRFMFYDIDGGWGQQPVSWDLLSLTLSPTLTSGNPPYATMLLRNMMESEDFKNDFLTRMACLLRNDFTSDTLISNVDSYKSLIEPGISEHIDRWQRPNSVSSWNSSVQSKLTNFALGRHNYVIGHIESQFDMVYDIDIYDCTIPIDTIPVDTTTIDTSGINIFNIKSAQLLLYPSPVKSVLNISYKNPEQIKYIEIYSNTSQLIYREPYTESIDMSGYSEGIYFIKIYSQNQVYSRKIIKI